MRKAISTVVVACAFVAGAAGVASASAVRAHGSTKKRCGTKYTPACTTPKITNKPVSPKCVDVGSTYVVPTITLTSNSGIRKVQVQEGSHSLKSVTFKGQGVTQYSIKSLGLSTTGLASGAHSLSVKVTDIRGRSASKTFHFSICVATPVFTG